MNAFRDTTFIYILICPMNGRVKYCGKANNPEKRLKDHCLDFRCMDEGMERWIKKILAKGLRPKLGFGLFNKRSRNGLTYANSKTFRPGNRPWNAGLKLKERNKNNNSVPPGGLPGYYPVPSDITEPVDDLPF